MAVDTTVLFKRYDCDGANKSFPITFDYLETAGFVQVLLYDSSAGSYTTLALTTDYTVSADTVTTVATHGSTYDILLRLDFTDLITQGTDWVENDKFTSGSWENAVDKLTLVCQWLAEQVNRSIKGPPVDVAGRTWEIDGALDSASGWLTFDASGNAIVSSSVTPSVATVTAFAETFLDDTSLGAMLSTLEIPFVTSFSAFAKTLIDDTDADVMLRTLTYLTSVKAVSAADYITLDADGFTIIDVTTGASARTVTLPARATNANRNIRIRKADSGAGKVIVDGAGTDLINGTSLWDITEQYGYVELQENGTEWGMFSQDGSLYQVTDTSLRSQSSPTSDTWYNLGSMAITVPVSGFYEISYGVLARATGGGTADGYVTLSTGTTTETDKAMTSGAQASDGTTGGGQAVQATLSRRKRMAITGGTVYYLNMKNGAASATYIAFMNDTATLRLEARRIG